MTTLQRVIQICDKLDSFALSTDYHGDGRWLIHFRSATRLWNWIDSQETVDPEPLWGIMQQMIPWAFDDSSSVNSMRFSY